MNVKRYLKKQAQKDQQAILDTDGGKTLRELGIDYPAAPSKKRSIKGWVISAGSIAASLALIVCIVMFYPADSQTIYWDANFESRESTLTEMNSEVHDFSFEIDESLYSSQIIRTYDSVSNDVLYYTVSLSSYDSLIKMELVAVCNPKFEYKDFSFQNAPVQKSLAFYNVLYDFETQSKPQFDLNVLTGKVQIEGESDIVYVKKYEELLVQPETTFFDVIQTIVKPVK